MDAQERRMFFINQLAELLEDLNRVILIEPEGDKPCATSSTCSSRST